MDKKEKWFTFNIKPKNRDKREELSEIRPRFQKIKNEYYNVLELPLSSTDIIITYLNWESAKGLYKEPKNNLPYEIMDFYGRTIYRQSMIEKKEDIFNRLEKLAVEEELRK
jgi:hypothetical protein